MKIALLCPEGSRRWAFNFIMEDFKKFVDRPSYTFDLINTQKITETLREYDWIISPLLGQDTYDTDFFKEAIRPHFIAWLGGMKTYGRIKDWSLFKYVFVQSRALVRDELRGTTFFVRPTGIDTEMFRPLNIEKRHFAGITGRGGHQNSWKSKAERINTWFTPICTRAKVSNIILDTRGKYTVPREKMPRRYNQLHTFLCTFTSAGGPLTLLEAASCGLPIISTDVGYVKEGLINGNGFICNTRQEFVDALIYLKKNPDKKHEMGERSRELVLKNWTWEKRAEEWITTIEELS